MLNLFIFVYFTQKELSLQPKREHKRKTTISDKMNKSISLLLLGAMTIAACSDDTVPSAVDEKPWTLDGNKDISVSPGDDFFMYCNGAWYYRLSVQK